jgi:hypothetical protein
MVVADSCGRSARRRRARRHLARRRLAWICHVSAARRDWQYEEGNNMSLSSGQITTIGRQIYRQFPEVRDARPMIQNQAGARP